MWEGIRLHRLLEKGQLLDGFIGQLSLQYASCHVDFSWIVSLPATSIEK